MAATFPGGVYSPRAKANKAGVIYDSGKSTIGYAEDITKLDEEVVAMETQLTRVKRWETPAGVINGVNKVFTLVETPSPADSLILILNSATQTPGGEDFTLSTNEITFENAPVIDSVLRAPIYYY